jgi:hypothetical protein
MYCLCCDKVKIIWNTAAWRSSWAWNIKCHWVLLLDKSLPEWSSPQWIEQSFLYWEKRQWIEKWEVDSCCKKLVLIHPLYCWFTHECWIKYAPKLVVYFFMQKRRIDAHATVVISLLLTMAWVFWVSAERLNLHSCKICRCVCINK